MQEFGRGCTQYVVHGRNNMQRAPLIQLPAWADTRRRDYDIHGRP